MTGAATISGVDGSKDSDGESGWEGGYEGVEWVDGKGVIVTVPLGSNAVNKYPHTVNTPPLTANNNSNSYSLNPASTVSFMLNMGYPPPPIALEPLRRLVEQATQGPGFTLNLQSGLYVCDEITRSPFKISTAVLFVLQQRLHSSKADRIELALQLLDMCVKNCGLDFIRHINREFMKSIINVVKTKSLKDRTITGQMKKLEKYLTGTAGGGVATDPRIHRLRKIALGMVQDWRYTYASSPNQILPIVNGYNELKKAGWPFPTLDETRTPSNPIPTDGFGSTKTAPEDMGLPFNEKQVDQLTRLLSLLTSLPSPPESELRRGLDMYEKLRDILDGNKKELTLYLQRTGGRRIDKSDAMVQQLNLIIDVENAVKRIAARIGGQGNAIPTITPPVVLPPPAPVAPPINLLDDLLDVEYSTSVATGPIILPVEVVAKSVDTPDPFEELLGRHASKSSDFLGEKATVTQSFDMNTQQSSTLASPVQDKSGSNAMGNLFANQIVKNETALKAPVPEDEGFMDISDDQSMPPEDTFVPEEPADSFEDCTWRNGNPKPGGVRSQSIASSLDNIDQGEEEGIKQPNSTDPWAY